MDNLTKTIKGFYFFGSLLCVISIVAATVEPLRLMPDRLLLLASGFLLVFLARILQQLRDALSELPPENKVRRRILEEKIVKDKVFLFGAGITGTFVLIVLVRILIR